MFQSLVVISCGGEVIFKLGWCEGVAALGDDLPKVVHDLCSSLPLEGLELQENHSDKIEIGAVVRQEAWFGPDNLSNVTLGYGLAGDHGRRAENVS